MELCIYRQILQTTRTKVARNESVVIRIETQRSVFFLFNLSFEENRSKGKKQVLVLTSLRQYIPEEEPRDNI